VARVGREYLLTALCRAPRDGFLQGKDELNVGPGLESGRKGITGRGIGGCFGSDSLIA
jgi:hypothetical protein